MKFTVPKAMSSRSIPLIPTLGAVALAVLMSSCGGGGKVTDTGGRTQSGGAALRPLPVEFSTKTAVNYGPYRTSAKAGEQYLLQNGQCVLNPIDRANEVLTDAQVLEDLQLLVQAGFGVIRLFESSDKVALRALRVIRANALGLKVVLGAAIDSYTLAAIDTTCGVPTSDTANAAEIARAIRLANDYQDLVVAVSVGNEKMMSWATTKVATEKIAGYITTVRGQITQPVTADENWAFYANATNQNDPYAVNVILGAVDYVSMHTYPVLDTVYSPNLWDWRQKSVPTTARAEAMMTAAVESAKGEYAKVRSYLNAKSFANMPVVIGETGWKARDKLWGRGAFDFRAHPVNQWMYLKKLTDWAKTVRDTQNTGLAVLYFDAFDEPWKQADDNWGLFDVNRKARYAAQQLKPNATWPNGIETIVDTGDKGVYTVADAVYWSAPVVNTAVNVGTYSRYTLYADAVTAGELIVPTTGASALIWYPWDKTTGNLTFTSSGTSDGKNAIEFAPKPSDWGWGMFFGTGAANSLNLSQFSSGHLQFDIKTNKYPGKLEFGFVTNSADNINVEAYKALSSGMDGYVNDDAWHHVSIPIADLFKGNVGDLSMVMHAFVIADRFAYTGKANGTTGLSNVYVDKIYISKD